MTGGNPRFLRAIPSCAVAAGLSVLSGAAYAQSAHPVESCREAHTTDAKKIECLENALVDLLGPVGEPNTAAIDESLGAEQVAARNNDRPAGSRDEKTLEAAVAEIATARHGELIFFLENGQIWRQKSSDSNRVTVKPSRDYVATISKGALSGYRLKLNGVRRPLLVERLK